MEAVMERWGAFSVIDHKDEIKIATELLLYDKIAVPTPTDQDGKDWERWVRKGWDPEKLMQIIKRLRPNCLVREVKWDLSREQSWRSKFEEAKADIEKVNVKLQSGIDERVAHVRKHMSGLSKIELDQAIRDAGYGETRDEIVRNLRSKLGEEPVAIWNGPVEFYAAYQSKADFEQLHPDEDAVQKGVERVNFLIQHRLAVPDEPPEILLDRVMRLVTNKQFKDRRRQFYDYQVGLLEHGQRPELIVKEIDQLVADFNAQALADSKSCRWETVFTVGAIAGAAATAWAGFQHPGSPLVDYTLAAGAASTVGPVVWSKLQTRGDVYARQRIAAGGAMFHQMERDSGFQFRTTRRQTE
jgi:hypothetical protein